MRRPSRSLALSMAFALAVAAAPHALHAQALMDDMHRDVGAVQKKIIDLAKAMPDRAMDWRPAAGVRSTAEVLKHVAADNYLIPIMMGAPAPAATGISDSDMTSVQKYETRTATKAEVVAELEKSFAHLHGAMRLTTDNNLGEVRKFFGQDMSRQRMMILTLTHLHEHLGQLISYSRSNGVVPPWSK